MKRLIIDYEGETIRAACMTDNKLSELLIDHKKAGASQVGNIYNAIVKNILPSRFAFVDIGHEKNAFMNLPPESNLKPSQIIAVQVRKDASQQKGPNVSDILQLKGRLAIVYASTVRELGISSKITDNTRRKQLQKLAQAHLPESYSCILRTQSATASDEAIKAELINLQKQCEEIQSSAQYSPAPKLLHSDMHIWSELLTDELEEIILNDERAMGHLLQSPFASRSHLWKEKQNLFEAYGITEQIKKALHRKVWLPCGGFITIDPVEACVLIDVNSGKYQGKHNYHETISRVNLEASICIAEQINLRNLSGMIIVDFIDTPSDQDKTQLLSTFKQALSQSRIPTKIIGMTTLGLVQLTRRKQREPLHQLLQQTCPHCKGSGRV